MIDEPRNSLEQALAQTQRGERTLSAFVQLLAQSPLFVLLSRPWDGHSPLDPETRMLLVSDGADIEQPMLAVFTNAARAAAYGERAPGFSVTEMPAMMVFLGVRDGQGVIVNPNDALTMRMKPLAAKIVRDTATEVLDRLRARQNGAGAGIDPSR